MLPREGKNAQSAMAAAAEAAAAAAAKTEPMAVAASHTGTRPVSDEPKVKARLHYLGPPGTYSHQAALIIAPRIVRRRRNGEPSSDEDDVVAPLLFPAPTIEAAFRAALNDDRRREANRVEEQEPEQEQKQEQKQEREKQEQKQEREKQEREKQEREKQEEEYYAARTTTTTRSLALLPYENSTYGPVVDTYDILAAPSTSSSFSVIGDILLPVSHCLLVSRATHGALRSPPSSDFPHETDGQLRLEDLTQIRKVYSHGQALGQCRRFLDAYLPQAARVAVDSTGDGAVRIGSGGGAATFEACIASEVCARDEIYGLSIARRAIQDRSDNTTRFLLVEATKDREADVSSTLTVLPPSKPPPSSSKSSPLGKDAEQVQRKTGRAIVRVETSLAVDGGGFLQDWLYHCRDRTKQQQSQENISRATALARKIDRVVPKVREDDEKDRGLSMNDRSQPEEGSSWPCVYLVEMEARNVLRGEDEEGTHPRQGGGEGGDAGSQDAHSSDDGWDSILSALDIAHRTSEPVASGGDKVRRLGVWQSS